MTVEYLASIPFVFQGNFELEFTEQAILCKTLQWQPMCIDKEHKIIKFIVFYLSLHFHKLVMIHKHLHIHTERFKSNYVHYTFLKSQLEITEHKYIQTLSQSRKNWKRNVNLLFEIPINSHFWPNRKSIICQDRNKFCFMYLKLLDR